MSRTAIHDLQPSVAWVDDRIEIIDQTLLPEEFTIIALTSVDQVVDAIRRLAVRGAPAIGACGALGLVVGINERRPHTPPSVRAALSELAQVIGSARPTAVNLRWAVERVSDAAAVGDTYETARGLALAEALAIIEEDKDACARIGEFGRTELSGVTKIMTHCNTGRLATAGWGTALGVIYAKAAAGEPIQVLATETRPLLQGARLTMWELQDAGIDVTLIADGTSGAAMSEGKIEAVVVGADRIAANGDTANKIGTFTHAVNAKYAGIPFYVAAPLSTFDLDAASAADIPVELRADAELTTWRGQATAPANTITWNPAFDVTPSDLITAFITELGVLHPPYAASIRHVFDQGVAT